MNWLNFFNNNTIELKHQFGRDINATISKDEEQLFNKSSEAFQNKNILDAYMYFFQSLENFSDAETNNNITFSKDDDKLNFIIFQGSAKINGYITQEYLFAETIITKKENAHIALKRYLLERNYQLTYSCYYVDHDYIKLKLYHDNITMTPQKIFFPIREIALNADFDKEYIKTEFPDTVLEDIKHLQPLPKEELEIKYNFLQKWIKELDEELLTLPTNDTAGMQSFLYLCLLLKIDYLIVPNYEIYQKTAKKIQNYFNDENNSLELNNEKLLNFILELKEITFEKFETKLYNAKYTFNPIERASQKEIEIFINESLAKIRWYKNNRYQQIIPTIYKYIAFHILYNYGLHPVVKQLLHILVEVQNPEYFQALGYVNLYDNQEFSKKTIILKIDNIIKPYQSKFKLLEPFGENLNFSSLNEFSNSFYLQINNLNFEDI